MKFTFNLFLLEIKRTLRFIPRIMFFMAVVFAFLFFVMFVGSKNEEKTDPRVKIGYFTPDKDDVYIPMLVNMVNDMDSVKSICVLEPAASEQQVYDDIKSGKLYGGIIFPERYVQGIMYGSNEPALVIVPGGNNNAVFRRLVSVGSDMLVSVQAGIYAAADGKNLSKKELLGINLEYANVVLGRGDMFDKQNWSAYGVFSFTQYYCIMLLSLVSILIGTVLSFLFYDYGESFKSYGKLWQYNGVFMLLLKQLLIFLIISAVVFPMMIFADKRIPFIEWNYPMILTAIFIASEIIVCFYTAFGNGAVLLLTVFTLITGFLSGCFIPIVYLSKTGLDKLCEFMPIYMVSKCFSSVYTYGEVKTNALPMIAAIYAVTFIICMLKNISFELGLGSGKSIREGSL